MRLSFSTNGFTAYSVYEAVEHIAEIGYEGVELLADKPHLYADTVSTDDLEHLKSVIHRTGITPANINANTAVGWYGREFWEPLFEPSLASPDPDLRRWRIDYSKKCIDMAKAVGSPCVSLTSGRLVPGVDPEDSMDFLTGSLREVAEYAEQQSIRVGIEYEPGLIIERYEELVSLLERIGSASLGANLDLGHSRVLGEDPETVIRGLGSRIFHIHLEDIRAGKHYHLIPGTGDMDFGLILGLLEENGYQGFVTVELYTYVHKPSDAAKQSLNFLKNILTAQKRGRQ